MMRPSCLSLLALALLLHPAPLPALAAPGEPAAREGKPAASAEPASMRMPGEAVDTLHLTLRGAVARALGSSPEAIRTQWDEQSSELNLRASRFELYRPRLDATLMAPSYSEVRTEQWLPDTATGIPRFQWFRTENLRWSSTLTLRQPLPTGGDVSLQSNLYRRFLDSDFSSTDDPVEYSSSWRLSLSQQLLRASQARLAARSAELERERSRHAGTKARRELAFRIVESYYNLLEIQRELEISREDLAASEEAASLARRKFDAGLIPEVEALQFEVEVAQKRTELASREAAYEDRLDRFRQTLGLELGTPLQLTSEPEFEPYEIRFGEALERARKQREMVRLNSIAVTRAEWALEDVQRGWHPGAQLTGFYDLERRDPELGGAVSTEYDDYNVNRGVTLTLNIPIVSGGRRSVELQQARLALRRSTFDADQAMVDLTLEVRGALRALREAKQRYELSLRSLEIAETNYEITTSRFENGQVLARQWIEAQITLKRNRVSALRALIDHNLAVARMRMTMGDAVLPGVPAE